MNNPNQVKKDDDTVESNTFLWHKSAPWLISAAALLGLIIIMQR